MKNLFLTSALLLSFSFGFSQTDSTEQVSSQMSKIVKLNKEDLPANRNKIEVVLFSFNIQPDGTIKVLDVNYSNEKVKKALMDKLSKAVLKNKSVSNKIHYIKVLFKKL